MIDKILSYWRSRGVIPTLRHIAHRLQFVISPPETASETRERVSRAVSESLQHEVIAGLFTGMRLLPDSTWGRGDRAGQLLGLYEQEVQDVIAAHHADYDCLIDLGAADGYYAVGCIFKGLFSQCYAFEANEDSRDNIQRLSSLNGLTEKVHIRGMATNDSLLSISPAHRDRSFVIVDIEGGEFTLLTAELVSVFSGAFFLIELHPGSGPQGLDALGALSDVFRPTHDVDMIRQGPRDPNRFDILKDFHDHERWLVASENRGYRMEWLVAKPRPQNLH